MTATQLRQVASVRVSCRLAAAMLLAGPVRPADKKTDAQMDGLLGPVRSVSTRQELGKVDLPPEKRATWVIAAWCEFCEYDREGNRLRSGQETMRIVRDENNGVSEKIFENPDGDVYRHEVWGPFGITAQTGSAKGKAISHSTWRYDENGHVAEFHNYDQEGVQVQSSLTVNGKLDHNREEWDYGKGGIC